jgi:hypothetical protein
MLDRNHSDMTDATDLRGEELRASIIKAAEARGYPNEEPDNSYRFTHQFRIHGEAVQWFLYERYAQRQVPLTKKELKNPHYSRYAERGRKPELHPSGWFILIFKVDYHLEIKIRERARHPLKADEILDHFERVALEAAEQKKRDYEEEQRSRRRAIERRRSRRVEDGRWKAINNIISAAERAERLRSFIDIIAGYTPVRPDQERRIRKFVRWASREADMIDPMAQGLDLVLDRLRLAKR